MSGPKVVRIVTREEILEICQGHLQRLAHAFSHWQDQSRRLGEFDDQALAATIARHERLRQLLVDDQLTQLQAEIPLEIGFLERDLVERQERAVARASLARNAQRNLRQNAASLLTALERDSQTDEALVETLRAIAKGWAVPDAAAVVARGFACLGRVADKDALNQAQRDLARQLQVERTEKWSATREPRLERIDEHVARLQTLYGTAAEPFLQRLLVIEGLTPSAQRDMLLDSLVLDLAAEAAACKARSAQLSSLRMLASELEALGGQASSSTLAQVEDCLANQQPDMQHVEVLAVQCRQEIAQSLAERAAIARRRAVLEGLASLGYEVREGMETAWAQAGNVVLRKTATPGFGVEVGGRAESGRLQVRAVSLSGAHDRARDRDIETIWCGEFTRLRALLAQQGNDLSIEKALGIGEVALKVVALESDSGSWAIQSDSKTGP